MSFHGPGDAFGFQGKGEKHLDSIDPFFSHAIYYDSWHFPGDKSTKIQFYTQKRENVFFLQVFSLAARRNGKTIEQLQLKHSET